jgi:predicted PurR-regulated permease PerM
MEKTDDNSTDQAFQRNAMTSFIQIGVLVLLLISCFKIISPFLNVVIWGLIISVALYPLHLKLAAVLGGRQKWSATLFVLVGLSALLIPSWIMGSSSIHEIHLVSTELQSGEVEIPPPDEKVATWPLIGEEVYKVWSSAASNLESAINQFEPQLAALGKWLLRAAAEGAMGVLQFAFSIIIAGVFLVSANAGYRMSCALAARVAGKHGESLTDLSIQTIRSVTKGVLGVAIIQAVLSAIGLVAMGVPGTGIWVALILMLAIMQLPPLLVLGPIAVWVFSTADTVPAVIFAVYAFVVSVSDSFLKPMFLGKGVDVPMLVILIGAIGGAMVFGILGLFVGAVVLALGYKLLTAWMAMDAAESESGQQD